MKKVYLLTNVLYHITCGILAVVVGISVIGLFMGYNNLIDMFNL